MKRIIPIIIILAVLGSGYWWFTHRSEAQTGASTGLVGSGSIEAETVAITAELGGRIVDLKVAEGQEVEAGQVLVELDKSDLLAQQAQLQAAVSTARANLELVSAHARPEDIVAAQAKVTQAEVARDGAALTSDRAAALAGDPHALEAQVNQAQARVTEAEKNLELAQVNVKRMEIQVESTSRNQSSHAALVQHDVAQYQLQAVQMGLEMAEVALTGSKQQVEHLVQQRNQPLALMAQAHAAEAAYHQAEAGVEAATANLVAVKADPTPEDIAIAQAKLFEAEASLAAVEVQLGKQTLVAPRAGLISQKLVNPGELAAPGTILLELSDIETVDLVVYIPETQIGEVKIGQKAQVYVDAYQGEVFEGTVTFIAHEAEFTPRNVQTQEERVNLVFAVKITLDNADHRLKPGMPADAEILPKSVLKAVEAPSPTATSTLAATPTITPTPVDTATPTPAVATTKAEVTPTNAPTTTPEAATPTRQAEILTWALKVRTGPGIDYPVVAHLSQGNVVSVLAVDPKSGWLQVQLPDGETTGWITNKADYVSFRG